MIKIIFEEDKKRAAAYDGYKNIGESTYSKSDKIWIIDHTQVDDDYRGQNIAAKLVAKVVDNARKQNVRIMPLCPFAKREFERKQEYKDIWAK